VGKEVVLSTPTIRAPKYVNNVNTYQLLGEYPEPPICASVNSVSS
jgi:hypothetical protein